MKITEGKTDLVHLSTKVRRTHHRLRFSDREGKSFFAKDMLLVFQSGQSVFGMVLIRRGNGNTIQVVPGAKLAVIGVNIRNRHLVSDGSCASMVAATNRYHFSVRMRS